MFYAVYVDEESMQAVEVGRELELDQTPLMKPKGRLIPIYPIDQNGIERRWSCSRTTMQREIDDGNIVAQRNRHGVINIYKKERKKQFRRLNTVWTENEYSAGDYGSRLVNTLLGKANAFPFPKSVYAVRDTVGSVARPRPDAIVLDFFAGSATTLHAVALLNREDGGARRSIVVTNNELNDEQVMAALATKGIAAGDPEWEAQGICEVATWPRIKASLTGKSPAGIDLPGKYLGGRPMSAGFEENAAYFKLDFLDPADVTRGEKFESIVPILWMLAGCRGACEVSKGAGKWFMPRANPFAVLLKEDVFDEFQAKLAERPDIDHAFLVTDSTEAFHEMAADLGRGYKSIQLYRSYIDTFRINLTDPGTITPGGVPAIPRSAASLAPLTQEVSGAV
jgi:adenine-specific DNA-methyltransferase